MSGQILDETIQEDIIEDKIIKEDVIKEEKLSKDELVNLPENISIYKCNRCRYIFRPRPPTDMEMIIVGSTHETCPLCEMDSIDLLCKVDLYSTYLKVNDIVDCRKATIISKTDLCPVCNRPMCPICYNHSCVSLSRVTGYIQAIEGWNEAKKQELLDRKRYLIEKDGISRMQ